MRNIALIYQPHFKTNMFRVSAKEQTGSKWNFIVVTCSPNYNGVWKYSAENVKNYDVWYNGKLKCYCVPISECTFVKQLEGITNQEVISAVKKQQQKWINSDVKNREYVYKNQPSWIL